NWDPAGVRQQYEAAGEGNLIYRMALSGSGVTIRTDGAGATIAASVTPGRITDAAITWSTKSELVTLSRTTAPNVVVTARNTSGKPQWVAINATIANGFYVTAYVYAEPRYISPPAITSAPKLGVPQNGAVNVAYTLELGGHDDQSLVSWSVCDDAACAKAREVAV